MVILLGFTEILKSQQNEANQLRRYLPEKDLAQMNFLDLHN